MKSRIPILILFSYLAWIPYGLAQTTLFDETWSEETAGDNLSQLTNWSLTNAAPPSTGAIVDSGGGDNVLEVASTSLVLLTTASSFLDAEHNQYNISFGLGIASGSNNFVDNGIVVEDATNGNLEYRLFSRTIGDGTSVMRIQKNDNGSFSDVGGQFNVGNVKGTGLQDYSWIMTTTGSATSFDLYFNDVYQGTIVDSSSPIDFASGFKLAILAQPIGQPTTWDDISVTSIPEPAEGAMVIGSVLLLMSYLRRRRRP